MDEQVQCINCYGFKVETTHVRIDPVTGEVVKTWEVGDGCALGIGLLIGLAILNALVIGLMFQGKPNGPLQGGIEAILLLSFLALPIIIPIIVVARGKAAYNRAIPQDRYYCTICGRRWSEVPQTLI